MYEIGKKDNVLGTKITGLVPVTGIWQRPDRMPYTPTGKVVICGFDQGLGERMLVCESLADMQYAYDQYFKGIALSIQWYLGEIVQPTQIMTLNTDDSTARMIINDLIPDANQEVRDTVAAYAMGNFGAAHILCEAAKTGNFTTAKQVEDLVGWPLSEHNLKRTGEIWDNLRPQQYKQQE